MNCASCKGKTCRTARSCGAEDFPADEIIEGYLEENNQAVVRAAARLVDGGLAGQLSRIEELRQFIKDRGYRRVGLAYCYGMEKDAQDVISWFEANGIGISAVSCTVGGLAQNRVNAESSLCGVSCNPLGQAAQLRAEGVDLAIQFGLCLGHDILFGHAFTGDQTVLVVKDRVNGQRKIL